MSKTTQIDSCLLVNRRVEQLQEHSITCTEITQRRVLHEKNQEMHQYSGSATPEMSANSYLLDSSYRPSLNGHPDNHSPSSLLQEGNSSTLTRGQKPPPTQQVSTVSKVVREMHHLAPENSDIDYVSAPYQGDLAGSNIGAAHSQYAGYMDHMAPSEQNRHYNDPYHSNYQDYDVYPNSGGDYGMVYDSMNMSVGQYQPYGNAANYADHSQYSERPPTPPSPSERSDSPPPQQLLAHEYMRKGAPYPASGYDELDATSHMIPRSEHFRITPSPGAVTDRYDQMSNSWNMDENAKPLSIRHGLKWRDPNFTEVISFLSNPNDTVKANAAAYLQHLCYMDDPNKQKTRTLGGIPPLVKLLNHESPAVYRNAAGALRNLSYGRQNDENKRVIKLSGGIPLLINLLRKLTDPEVKELVTGILWNLSSCEDLKRTIIDDGLSVLVNHIIIPHSGWSPTGGGTDTCWSTVFRNTSGVLRNVSSAGEFARKKLRECDGLVDSLLYVVKNAIDKSNIGNKSVENCVCVLRNLSYRCQEVEDSNYDKHPIPTGGKVGTNVKAGGENLGCFGASKKKKEGQGGNQNRESVSVNRSTNRTEPVTGMELLWQPEVVQVYLTLLQTCSNPETLEAAAGALQNLAACYWQPSIEIRAAVRKDKGLPILVELLRMEVDRVVCAVATALRNLAIDHRNKELIGKYAMRDLVQKLPSGSLTHDQITSDDTIAAVLATLNEVIKKNAEFSRSLLEASGVERLMNITRHRQKYTPRVLKFAGQVLFTMWQHQELREVYKKNGWKEQDFVTKTVAARNAGPNSPSNANSTLNRPMASQGGTRYEDRTLQRPQPVGESSNRSGGAPVMSAYQMPNEEIPMPDMSYPEGSSHMPPAGGVRIFPPGPVIKPGEPLYAQVNREKKKNRQYDPSGTETIGSVGSNDAWSGYDDQSQDHHLPQHQSKGMVIDPKSPPSGGDSWV